MIAALFLLLLVLAAVAGMVAGGISNGKKLRRRVLDQFGHRPQEDYPLEDIPAYCQLEYMLHDRGRTDAVLGTVEGYPGFEEVLRRLGEREPVRKAVLHPLMVVAGDHAKNDLAGDGPESWKSQLLARGCQVSCEPKGLGEYPQIRALFVRHALEAEEDR